ncbi:MAG: hypothetical protein ACK502_06845 [Alphaproteobacteria bacterium]
MTNGISSELSRALDLIKDRKAWPSSAAFDSHFSNAGVASKFEHAAQKGDLYAAERMYRVYNDWNQKLDSYSGQYGSSYYVHVYTIDSEAAERIRGKTLSEVALDYPSNAYFQSGRRQLQWRPLSALDMCVYQTTYDARTKHSFIPDHYSLRTDSESEKPEVYLGSSKITTELSGLSVAAASGSAAAADILGKFYDVGSITYAAFLRNKRAGNPHYNSQKSGYYSRLHNFLTGKNDAMYGEYVDARLKDPEGMYDVAEAIITNQHVRKSYNQKNGIAGDSDQGARDILKNAANLGYANAAWRLARLHHEQYIMTDSKTELQQLFHWYKKAAELGNKEASHHIAYFKAQFPDIEATAASLDKVAVSNPTSDYLAKRPDALGEVVIPEADIAFLKSHNPDIKGSLTTASSLLDKQLGEMDKFMSALQAKIKVLLDNATRLAEAQAAIAGREDQIHQRVQALHEMRMILADDKGRGAEGWVSGANTLLITANPKLAILDGLMRSTLEKVGTSNQGGSFENYLKAQRIKVELVREEVANIDQAIAATRGTALVKSIQKDEVSQRRLLSAYLKKTLIDQGLKNIASLEPIAKQHGFNSVDHLISVSANIAGDQGMLAGALGAFVRGFADTKDMETIIAHANRHTLGGKESEFKVTNAIVNFVEQVIKPNIDQYSSLASRVDVLKAEGVDFVQNPNATLATRDYKNPTFVKTLLETEYSVSGSAEVAKMFDHSMHRHGKHVIYDPTADGVQHTKKTIDLVEPDEVREYSDLVAQKSKRGDRTLPPMPSLFTRTCANEYLTPLTKKHAESTKFHDRPDAALAYVTATHVVADFIDKMSLSPLAKYRATLKDKSLVDNVIAQTFFDFFSSMGVAHKANFAAGFQDVERKFGSGDFTKASSDLGREISKDMLAQYDVYAKLLEANLKKSLSDSIAPEARQLLAQLDALEKEGVSIVKPEIIKNHASQYLDELRTREMAFENMSPAARSLRGK